MQTSDAVVPSLERMQRTLAVDISYTISRMKVLERLPGNPIGINYRWVDETAVALMSRLPSFCRVVGLRAGHEQHIEGLVCWYREHGIKPTFEMVPGHYAANLGLELTRLGFFQSGFHVSLIGEPTRADHAGDPVTIDRVTAADTMEDYLDAYVAGWGIAEKDQAQFRVNVRPWLRSRMVALRRPIERSTSGSGNALCPGWCRLSCGCDDQPGIPSPGLSIGPSAATNFRCRCGRCRHRL